MATDKYSCFQNTGIFRLHGLKHLFEGTLSLGEADGYHYEGFPENYSGKIVPGTDSQLDRHEIYEADIMVNGVRKLTNNGRSSFFPKHWSPQEVIDAINEVYRKRYLVSGNRYEGETQSGIRIRMYLDNAEKIISAFPIYESPGATLLGLLNKSSRY